MTPSELFARNAPVIMGILNVTPDSFSDGGQYQCVDAALEHGCRMVGDGADIIDIGGESTRPGSTRVPAREQLRRVRDVVRNLRQNIGNSALLSIDTTSAEVAEHALDLGIDIINDISAGSDERMFPLAGMRQVPIILMHMQGSPATMQLAPCYQDVVTEVKTYLLSRAQQAIAAGIDASRIIIDPGIGFGKTLANNLEILNELETLAATGYLVMLGASRKSVVRAFSRDRGGNGLIGGTCATTAIGALCGVRIFRVHDVAVNRDAADMAWALRRSA